MPYSQKPPIAPKYYFSDTSFESLMKKRIYHVLLISSTYDAFILEDDGRIDEQIFNEYVSLNLRYPPRFILAGSEKEAIHVLREEHIDLVITMLATEEKVSFDLVEKIKTNYPSIPIVVLVPFSREVKLRLINEDLGPIDYVFSWLGNADLLLAIIKLLEDRMNAVHDILEVGVQAILLVEDSTRFYSSYLPNLYKNLFKQSKEFMLEGLNEHQQMMRMRGRPKILLATNYEEAEELYEKYKKNLLGVITDMSYRRNGKEDKYAGINLCKKISADEKNMPLLLQSVEDEGEQLALDMNIGFIHKNSKTISIELRDYMKRCLAFGDFIFEDPKTGVVIERVTNLKDLQDKLFSIPDEALIIQLKHNQFSKWLRARAIFTLAEMIADKTLEEFDNLNEVRRFLFDAITSFRISKAQGVIAQFRRETFDQYFSFSRIGEGSIGGKARGLAFLDMLIKRNKIINKWEDVHITIPRTVILCTDVFDEFMEKNDLYDVGLSDSSDEEILNKFVKARLPFRIHEDLLAILHGTRNPIAIRSSSLLEDSHYQPFAGIYSTYMIPYIVDNERLMLEMLSTAIKSVYASVFYKDSKAYMAATSNVIDEEKMSIVLQVVAGNRYGDHFYPTISGVARSINFYPIGPEKPEEGIANVALGLGKYIVDGGLSLRFSPLYPKKVLQTSAPELALRETQSSFYALDLNSESFHQSTNDAVNLVKLKIDQAAGDGPLKFIGSTMDFNNNIIRDGINQDGKKLVTFNNILKHDSFPLADILKTLLQVMEREMGNPVEIEFVFELNVPENEPKIFYLLQIRPIVENKETIDKDLETVNVDDTIINCKSALGNGIINDIQDLVYVRPESFDPARNSTIVEKIGRLNDEFIKQDKNYILVGPGRWGSADPWLGIPVKWPQISAARVIVESGLENYRIDPSQGTHFFQNLTSFRVGYFTINSFINDGSYDLDYLNSMDAQYEDEHLRHIRFERPLLVEIDGRKNLGVIYKMGVTLEQK